jgi:hypothetical protein
MPLLFSRSDCFRLTMASYKANNLSWTTNGSRPDLQRVVWQKLLPPNWKAATFEGLCDC